MMNALSMDKILVQGTFFSSVHITPTHVHALDGSEHDQFYE